MKIDIKFSEDNQQVDIANTLQQTYPNHLILIQSGAWVRAFNKSAYLLNKLKGYKLTLAGPVAKPHLRAGMPLAKHKNLLWPLKSEYQLAWVIYSKAGIEVSDEESCSLLSNTSDNIIDEVISDLVVDRDLNTVKASKKLANPDTHDFIFKTKASALDEILTADLFKLPRDIRATWGENVRQTMHRIMRNTFLYGNADNKSKLLKELNADVDLITYYVCQAKTLKRFAINFDSRIALVVELGRLIGGLQRAQKVAP